MDPYGESVMKEKLTELYAKRDMEEFIKLLETIPPNEVGQIWVSWANESFKSDEDAWDAFWTSMTAEQMQRLQQLDSSDRQKKYLMEQAATRELTDKEWADLRACDF